MKYLHEKQIQIGGDKEIKIHIIGIAPQDYELDYKNYLFFKDIQEFVLHEKLIPIDKQKIYYKGTQLNADQLLRSLADLNFQSGDKLTVSSTLHVFVRISGTCDKNFIEIVDDETFGTLKEKISNIKGVPVDKIEIYSPEYEKFTGKIIKESHKVSDDKFFGEYNIISGMIIDYVIIP